MSFKQYREELINENLLNESISSLENLKNIKELADKINYSEIKDNIVKASKILKKKITSIQITTMQEITKKLCSDIENSIKNILDLKNILKTSTLDDIIKLLSRLCKSLLVHVDLEVKRYTKIFN